MSGIEVAGLALGAMPLAIMALSNYKKTLAPMKVWRQFELEMDSLIENLECEYLRLQRFCGKHLESLVSSEQWNLMISDPFGSLWKEEVVQRRIKARLQTALSRFKLAMKELEKAILYIKENLGLDDQWNPKWIEGSAMKRELKRASFVLRKSAYDDAIESLKKNLSTLDSMMRDDIESEPLQQKRYKGRLVGLIRQTSEYVYYALRDSMSCRTGCRHQVHMDLKPDSEDATHDLDDTEMIEKLGFKLAMTYRTDMTETVSEKPDQQTLWEEVVVRASAPQVTSSLVPKSTPSPQPPARPQRKGVSFASMRKSPVATTSAKQPSITTLLTSTMSTLKLSAEAMNLSRQIKVCEELRRSHKEGISGTISHQNAGKPWIFTIYPKKTTGPRHDRSVISLKEFLENPKHAAMPFMAKLHLANMISSSLLQLHQTPWLPNILTSQDVYFITDGSQSFPNFRQAFIKKGLPENIPQNYSTNLSGSDVINSPLLSLGILLLELSLGSTIGNLRRPYDSSDASVAERLLRESPVDMMSSGGYRLAASWCVAADWSMPKQDFNDEGFRKDVYEGKVRSGEKEVGAVQDSAGTLFWYNEKSIFSTIRTRHSTRSPWGI
ncbi:hypothetical protein CFIO01_04294 [Colletotrichum fioriniae PJ7]|uniref:DUF7580 domain-containing protein n=1 Tax=Colletotrichum fioriniae PJ7 TaxID=1445577 RepID=A0A010QKM7_9PEZI|nr:hypothetical protein CFIO01_04294 [Colletotrichum fioriniae PJ7]